ncbi:penicillin-binding protein 2 [Nitrogeniibacter mangrovi]|uniref:Peptidoglycan D,D-transpeptidase MrdA n=1 Tax=Nitrogeniibacter mangrovi TaxID=2016596 RepID=A0A6C1B0L7_9RHOO|nr:penicillin-binding protein 2 [Nitrogeniibacter mangrovi]
MTEFRSPDQEVGQLRQRVVVAGVFMFLCLCVLAGRFFYLQVMRFDYYHTRAEDNRIAVVPVPPNRGTIVDRKGEVLARNFAAYTLEINPSRVEDVDATIDALGQIVQIDDYDRRRFRKFRETSKYFESVPIRTRLTDVEVARFVARRYRFPGVDVRARLFREYPHGDLFGHVIGYMGRINTRDEARIEEAGETANYRGTDHIGKRGLEQSYESLLHGHTGSEQVEVDVGGRAVRVLDRRTALPGHSLILTVDVDLQRVATQAFAGRRGALVAMNPKTGGVLALVSSPSFDPNLFVDGISVADWRALNDSPDHPLLNRAIYSAYPPGSTFKPFMGLAGLELGKRTPEQSIVDPGYFVFGGHRFLDDKPGGHGVVDMHKSIVESCNTYYYMLANDLGIEAIADFMAPFGFGQPTGIDIPGEASGVLPSPAWKKARFRKPGQQRWYGGETISVGIGQGYNAYTPIQLATALSTLVNNGVMFRPHLVQYIVDPVTGARTQVAPDPVRRLPLKAENLAVIRAAMVDVTRTGTGARAFAGAPYAVGGKTGTAQVYSLRGSRYKEGDVAERLRDHSWFIAYAPAEDPKIAMAVLVENGGFGSRSAAPIARQVLDYYLLGKRPEGPPPGAEDAGPGPAGGD